MLADGSIYVVSHVGKDLQDFQKVASILGEYIQTEATCYRKEVSGKPVGGKLEFQDGYWYLVDKVGTQVAWVESTSDKVPGDNWQMSGEGYVFNRTADAQLSVKLKASDTASGSLAVRLRAKANQHIDTLKAKAGAHLPVLKEQANKHMDTAKQTYNDVAPVVKQKTKEGYDACYEFWTHPDTIDAMKTGAQKTGEGLMYCGATCLSCLSMGYDLLVGRKREQEAPSTQVASALQEDEEGDFVKLEPSGVVPEPVSLQEEKIYDNRMFT